MRKKIISRNKFCDIKGLNERVCTNLVDRNLLKNQLGSVASLNYKGLKSIQTQKSHTTLIIECD